MLGCFTRADQTSSEMGMSVDPHEYVMQDSFPFIEETMIMFFYQAMQQKSFQKVSGFMFFLFNCPFMQSLK